ncbi:hypothetical protein TUSST3_08710 [Streptomyces sp. TUS-ST3]|uniref:hypothetical protein n=1 Tax=Streptomyces sp. TUS-ST3 TaxID=3025591 RepID=UPI0024E19340|nr:hypothetical protein [Streptomyces sp. TUS-ST3]GLP64251.1 hypothetical protein TUSST3_08710 [Streptomyces sp. TUS-ST3]
MVNIHTARTALYRLYDGGGVLLYVGITNMPNVRFDAHTMKPWWSQVAHKDVTWFDNRQQASQAEVLAIRNEHPVHNSMHAVPGVPDVVTLVAIEEPEPEATELDERIRAAAQERRRAEDALVSADAELRALLVEGRAAGKGPSHMAKLTGFTREWVAKIAPDPKASARQGAIQRRLDKLSDES